jgi:hypothetical protein
MMRSLGVSAAIVVFGSAAMAQPAASPFNTKDCPEPTLASWCASTASAQGWKLQYESKSRPDMMDASWLIELWIRGREAMLCEFQSGRGTRSSGCRLLREVAQ